MTIFVISKDGKPLMPTVHSGKVRRMLKDGRASIYKHHPFTIKLHYETTTYKQPIEFCCDTGDHDVGVSLKSESREYLSEEYLPLADEKTKRDNRRKYRKQRRSRLRHRKPRFDNRKNREGKLPPSIEHKVEVNLKAFKDIVAVCPVTSATFEIGAFDTQRLAAIQKGEELPEGEDYQKGPKYNLETLREAVFTRDQYTCQICNKGIKDGAILRVHHALYWQGRHSSQLDELITCCTECHTHANHEKGGKLYGYEPKEFHDLTGAAVMNQMRWRIYSGAKEIAPDLEIHFTYGAYTKAKRKFLGLEKSHVNDAYAMGNFHPPIRAEIRVYQKMRRNNRILEKFYDATYIDKRDGKKQKGAQLSSGRVSRNKNLSGENLRQYRGNKIKKGRRTIRKDRYEYRPGDMIFYKGLLYRVKGCVNYGRYIVLEGLSKGVKTNAIKRARYCGGYKQL